MKPEPPPLVKLICGILSSREKAFEKAVDLLSDLYGEIDYQSESFLFDVTEYYVPEMGPSIQRRFISFKPLISPENLAEIKLQTNEIETRLSEEGNRKVNLDPGYMDYDKVVLASAKYNGQKIYLEKGIYADLTLRFTRGHFEAFPWSFPDFKSGLYHDTFLQIRQLYRKNRKTTAVPG